MSDLRLRFERGTTVEVELRAEGTATIAAMRQMLPFESSAHRWGDEVYFDVPFHSALEQDGRAEMAVGEVAFWPDGDALAIFFGRTPASSSEEPMAVSPCNIIGAIIGDPTVLKSVRSGEKVTVERG